MKISHNKLHFERLSKSFRDGLLLYENSIEVMQDGMNELRDSYHSVKEQKKLLRTEKGFKKFGKKDGEKQAWISRLVIRKRMHVTTTKKKFQRYEPYPYSQLYFYRGVGLKKLEYVERLKDCTYSAFSILSDRRNMITEEEVESLKYYIGEVNYYNARMKSLRDSYLQHMETLVQLEDIL